MDPDTPAFKPDQVRRIARRLCAETLAWSRTFGACVGRPELESQVFKEMLSYALRLVQMQSGDGQHPDKKGFHRALRAECTLIFARWQSRSTENRKRLGRPHDGVSATEGAGQTAVSILDWSGTTGLKKEAFQAFQRATGLGSEALVGKEENLASLVFYIVVYGLYAGKAPLSGADGQKLLRAMHQCRVHLEKAVAVWLADPSEVSLALRG